MGLPVDGWMVAWTPAHGPLSANHNVSPGDIEVGPYPDRNGWSRPYPLWISAEPGMGHTAAVLRIFLEFHTMVVRDGIDPQRAHREFLKIDAYARAIAPDIEGALAEFDGRD